MTVGEYIADLETGIEQILQEAKFNNYRNQLFAWKLNVVFNRSYDESYLWNRALFLSTNGCQILLHGQNPRLAIKALKESAQIYENLHEISEKYDKDYALILSALCYDLAGYQANAVCLVRKTENYQFETNYDHIDISSDNYILQHFRQILIKNIPSANNLINRQLDNDFGIHLFNNAIAHWYDHILNDTENDFLNNISIAYRYYLNVFNIPISHLIFLLKTRINLYLERSIWLNLNPINQIGNNQTWKKYIKLLANDIYDGSRIKPIHKRLSKFELWTSQLRAVQNGVLSSEESFVIQMPTSAGKTFIAELSILNSLVKFPGKKCLYISPFRALTNEKERELSDNLSKLGYSVSALSGNYEIDEFEEIVLSDTDVLIATPEKIDLLLRLTPNYFNNVSLVVVDEGHILGDYSSRSSLLEFLIIRLRIVIPELKVFFISAVMPPANADQYAIWLSKNANNVVRSLMHPDSTPGDEWEPTRKLIGSFSWVGNNGNISYKGMQTEDEVTNAITPSFIPGIIKKRMYGGSFPNGTNKAQTSAALAFRLSQEGNTLVFCAQVGNTDQVGTALLNLLQVIRENNEPMPDWFQMDTDRESYFFARKWFGEHSYITRCLSYGIGIHFGDLPEAVRRSVEEDFVRGNLKVLISTNTIGQGLNFPIKNLIIHSTIITGGRTGLIKIGVRDFWNIIGRAGRAGMETEGQIIFNINTPADRAAFGNYTNKANIEPADSMFFKVLRALTTNRITQRLYDNYVRILAEPYILSLITEESLETDDEEIINSIIQNSLFNIQTLERGIDIEPLRQTFRGIFSSIKEDVPIGLIKVYGETGLSLKSNQTIEKFIDERMELISEIVNADNYLALIELTFEMFTESPISEIESEKLERITSSYTQLFPITQLWIQKAEIDELQAAWIALNENTQHLNILIADGYYYRFPWAISSFITIMLYKLNISRDELPNGISNVVSYIKYGLNNNSACLLRSIGIKNRDTATILAELSGGLEGRQLIRWISNLSVADLDQLDISKYDRQNILNIALKLTPQRYEGIPTEFDFYIKGVTFDEGSKFMSTLIFVGDILSYRREVTNAYDPFAIEVFYNETKLGYIPREFSKVLSVEIDINSSNYQVIVVESETIEDYNRILVKMLKI